MDTLTIVVLIELDDAVINQVDDEWRKSFYDLFTPEDIAEHIAYNLVLNQAELSHLDGWADLPDEYAKLIGNTAYWYHISAEEEKKGE